MLWHFWCLNAKCIVFLFNTSGPAVHTYEYEWLSLRCCLKKRWRNDVIFNVTDKIVYHFIIIIIILIFHHEIELSKMITWDIHIVQSMYWPAPELRVFEL